MQTVASTRVWGGEADDDTNWSVNEAALKFEPQYFCPNCFVMDLWL